MSDLLAEADRLALSELHSMLDCVQSDLSVNVEELESIHPQGTLGETLKEVLVEYANLKNSVPVNSIKLRPGWVCKDRHGCWWFSKQPVFTGYWDHLHGSYLIERSSVDPWPDKQIGGPDCFLEVK